MLRAGLTGAMLSLVLAGAAAAEPFQSFVDLCLSTNAEAHAAEVAAKGSGWRDVTAQMAADLGEGFQDLAAFLNFDPADAASMSPDQSVEILVTGWGDGEAVMETKGVVLDLCGVMSPQVDALTMGKQLTDHLLLLTARGFNGYGAFTWNWVDLNTMTRDDLTTLTPFGEIAVSYWGTVFGAASS